MKIALIHDWLTSKGGGERVLDEFHTLFPEAPIYTTVYNEKNFPELKETTVYTSILNKFPFAKRRYQVLIPLMPYAVEHYNLEGYNIILSDSHACAKGIKKPKNSVHICYCHTPMRYAWYPDVDDRASSSWLRRAAISYLKKWDLKTANRVDKFIANSDYVKGRIKEIYNRDAEVIYPPIDTNKWHISPNVGDYFLYVNRLVSHKKPEIIVQAFNKSGRKLKIVGIGPELENLKKIAKPNVEFLGRISDEELKKTYAECLALIYPSIDDFGMIAVEVMAAGRPVIAINQGGAAESVVEDKTGLHFDAQTPESINKAIEKFNPADFNPEEIRAFAKKFDTSVFQDKIRKAVELAKQELK